MAHAGVSAAAAAEAVPLEAVLVETVATKHWVQKHFLASHLAEVAAQQPEILHQHPCIRIAAFQAEEVAAEGRMLR